MCGFRPGGADSWRADGLWGKVRDDESATLAQARRRSEADRLPHGKVRGAALAYARCYEMARDLGMKNEAAACERGLARTMEESDRKASGAPQIAHVNGKKITVTTTDRGRKVHRNGAPGVEHTRTVRLA